MAQAFFSGAYVQGQTVDILGTIQDLSGHQVGISTLLNDETVYSSGAATINVAKYQNIMLDIAYGTAVTGSVNVVVKGFVPIVDLPGSTIIESGWYSGTVQTTQNVQVTEPLGEYAVISWDVVGSITGMYVIAEKVS